MDFSSKPPFNTLRHLYNINMASKCIPILLARVIPALLFYECYLYWFFKFRVLQVMQNRVISVLITQMLFVLLTWVLPVLKCLLLLKVLHVMLTVLLIKVLPLRRCLYCLFDTKWLPVLHNVSFRQLHTLCKKQIHKVSSREGNTSIIQPRYLWYFQSTGV